MEFVQLCDGFSNKKKERFVMKWLDFFPFQFWFDVGSCTSALEKSLSTWNSYVNDRTNARYKAQVMDVVRC